MSHNKKHLKPLYWGFFSVGGTIAALILASIIIIVCIFIPYGFFYDAQKVYLSFHNIFANKFVFFILAGIIFLLLWHAMHRLYYVLHDMHIHVGNNVRNALYLFAISAFIVTLILGWF